MLWSHGSVSHADSVFRTQSRRGRRAWLGVGIWRLAFWACADHPISSKTYVLWFARLRQPRRLSIRTQSRRGRRGCKEGGARKTFDLMCTMVAQKLCGHASRHHQAVVHVHLF